VTGSVLNGQLERQLGAGKHNHCDTLHKLTGNNAGLFKNGIQMPEGFGYGERVKVTPTLFAILQNAAQVMASDLDRQRVGDNVSCQALVLSPRRMGQRDPHRTPVDQELDVHRIGMAGCNRQHDALIDAADRASGPALDGTEILVHIYRTLIRPGKARNGLQKYRLDSVSQNKKLRMGNLYRIQRNQGAWMDHHHRLQSRP